MLTSIARPPSGTDHQPLWVLLRPYTQRTWSWWLLDTQTSFCCSVPATGEGGSRRSLPSRPTAKPPHLLQRHAGKGWRAIESCQLKIQIQIQLRSSHTLITLLNISFPSSLLITVGQIPGCWLSNCVILETYWAFAGGC